MIQVKFYEYTDKMLYDNKLKFAVIIAKYKGKWVFCKHKERTTFECPGGKREEGENIISAAERELYEETGAVEYCLEPLGIYSVLDSEGENFGMLYFADIKLFGKLPDMEIEKIEFFDQLPDKWTYPSIQPYLFQRLKETKHF